MMTRRDPNLIIPQALPNTAMKRAPATRSVVAKPRTAGLGATP
ncbi:hypothetical protein [Microvirga sp. KLBC 81]|nr:hypothetical protein [Microvirga sp. KLBC 81]